MNHSATIIGRSHRLMQQNCQDFATANQASALPTFGIVLDGCGSKFRDETGVYPANNEVGANLLGTFAATFLQRNLASSKKNKAIEKIVNQLYQASVTYLDCLTTLLPYHNRERKRFIATRLLCTMVGYVVTEETAVFFWSGDGYLGINDEIIALESNNRPDYLAYQLLEGRENGRFNTLTVRNRKNLNRLFVATDGWKSHQFRALPHPKNSLALQRWMNVQAKERGIFEDDGAIAVYYA
jgi:hypothetical protein